MFPKIKIPLKLQCLYITAYVENSSDQEIVTYFEMKLIRPTNNGIQVNHMARYDLVKFPWKQLLG